MKTLLISFLCTLGAFSVLGTAWLLAALALSRWRGRQVAKWLRDHEAAEWPERPMPRRKVQVQFRQTGRHDCPIAKRA